MLKSDRGKWMRNWVICLESSTRLQSILLQTNDLQDHFRQHMNKSVFESDLVIYKTTIVL